VGQASRTIEARHKEHMRYVRLEQPEKSVVAEHWLDTGHRRDFNGTSILGTTNRYMDHLMREAIEIQIHPNNFNRDEGFALA
jgi:hypothetical protein